MSYTDHYNELAAARDEYIKGLDHVLNEEQDKGKFSNNTLRFRWFDFNFKITTSVDPYKKVLTIKTLRVFESDEIEGQLETVVIEPLIITAKSEHLGSGGYAPCARFAIDADPNSRCYSTGIAQVNAFISKYKEVLEDYLKG